MERGKTIRYLLCVFYLTCLLRISQSQGQSTDASSTTTGTTGTGTSTSTSTGTSTSTSTGTGASTATATTSATTTAATTTTLFPSLSTCNSQCDTMGNSGKQNCCDIYNKCCTQASQIACPGPSSSVKTLTCGYFGPFCRTTNDCSIGQKCCPSTASSSRFKCCWTVQ